MLRNANLTAYYQNASHMAHEEHTSFLQVSNDVFRTFKQARRDLISGNGILTFDVSAARLRILNRLNDLRFLVSNETHLEDPVISDKLMRLSQLSSTLSLAFDEVDQFLASIQNSQSSSAVSRIDKKLAELIDVQAKRLIDEGIAEEKRELNTALNETRDANRLSIFAAIIAALLGLLVSAIVFRIMILRIGSSIKKLSDGAAEFSAGNLYHEIKIDGNDEFAALGTQFNLMAIQLNRQRLSLEDSRSLLEERVRSRTEQLNILNEKLELRDKHRREFFAEIGHELRTPITALRGEAEVALRSKTSHKEQYRAALERIASVSNQVTNLVNDIFLIAREQAGVLELRRDKVDLNSIIETSHIRLKTYFEMQKINASKPILPNEKAIIEGDEERLIQVMHILLVNAAKHGGDDTMISTNLLRDGNIWELSVSDNGPGVSADDIPYIFEKFYRGAQTFDADTAESGTGLGLPIARSIVQATGGSLEIDGTFKDGTRMVMRFPASQLESLTDDK